MRARARDFKRLEPRLSRSRKSTPARPPLPQPDQEHRCCQEREQVRTAAAARRLVDKVDRRDIGAGAAAGTATPGVAAGGAIGAAAGAAATAARTAGDNRAARPPRRIVVVLLVVVLLAAVLVFVLALGEI